MDDVNRKKSTWTVMIWKQALASAKANDDLYRADLELMLMVILLLNILF